jgi:hypothetical protein
VAAYEAVLVLAAARIQTLLLLEQYAGALHHAREFHRWHEQVLDGLTSIDIAVARSRHAAEADGLPEEDARTLLLQRSKPLLGGIHEIQLHVADRPAVMRSVAERGIRGREYVETLREPDDVPVLVLPSAERPR